MPQAALQSAAAVQAALLSRRSPEAFNKKPPRKPEKVNLVQEEVHPGKVIAVPCPGVARVYSRCRRYRLLFADS